MKKAIELARQNESVKKQQPTVRGQNNEQMAIEAIRRRHGRQLSKNPISLSANPAVNLIIVVADVANHPNMIREIVLLRIQFAINATRKAILKEYVDPKEKLEKCW